MSGFGGGDDWDDIEAEGAAARAAKPAPGSLAARGQPSAAATHGAGDVGSAYAGGGLSMDDDPFSDDVPAGALELDLPSHHQARSPRSMPAAAPSTPPREAAPSMQPTPSLRSAPPSQQASLPPTSQSTQPPGSSNSFRPKEASLTPPGERQSIQPRYPSTSADPASLIARFPAPPTKIHETPLYALHVILRQYELRQDLASLRKRRSPDVGLYERAIHTHDAKTFRLGLLLSGAVFTVATFLFFLPVILRFVHS